MHTHFAHRRLVTASRGGFTLVEMLVATTLVVMMMLMFAQIYVAAIGSLGEQQAVSRNDAKARLADLLLRGDLRRGSYRSEKDSQSGIFPMVRYETPSIYQRGYFYLSENDEFNPLDDVLQFTTFVSRYSRNRDPTVYYGRAETVTVGGVPVLQYAQSPSIASPQVQFNNHPDIDDSVPDGVGASRAAEVTYFVRNGKLYRRSLLVRDLDQAGNVAFHSAQPSLGTSGTEYSGRISPLAYTDPNYYKSFDYAAYLRASEADPTNASLDSVQFVGLDSLENEDDSFESLGRSRLRFGYFHLANNQYYAHPSTPAVGSANYELYEAFNSVVNSRALPVEFDKNGVFFGRPKHAETEFWKWGWPGNRVNPLGLGTLVYDSQTDQLSADFGSGVEPIRNPPDPTIVSRESEDLLLTNVEAFDVEVWDPGMYEHEDLNNNTTLDLGEDSNLNGSLDWLSDLNGNQFPDHASGWVQLGNTTQVTGYFRAANRTNSGYGPGEDANGNNVLDAGEDRNGNGVLDQSAVFDTGHPDMWTDDPNQPNFVVSALTNLVKPPYRPLYCRFSEDTNKNGSLDSGEDLNGNGVFDRPLTRFPSRIATYWSAAYASSMPGYNTNDYVFAVGDRTLATVYRCSVAGTTNPPGTSDWQAIDNRIGLQKIRITIRYRDSIENLPRQISIIHSFVNPQE